MKIFISWSGPQSRDIASILKSWLETFFESIDAFMSAHDIQAGGRWGPRLITELDNTGFGIICLTPNNLSAEWILFESGALSKHVTVSHVVPYLFKLKETDFSGPLSQFQAVRADQEGTKKLVESINQNLPKPRTQEKLSELFSLLWPGLDEKLKSVPDVLESKPAQRGEREMIEEILTIVRGQNRVEDSLELDLNKLKRFDVIINGIKYIVPYSKKTYEIGLIRWTLLFPTALEQKTGLGSWVINQAKGSWDLDARFPESASTQQKEVYAEILSQFKVYRTIIN